MENNQNPEKEETLTDGNQMFSKLPMDVFCDIFSRLPLKTISQSRWVCKGWYESILTSRFAKIHHTVSTKNSSHCVFLRDGKNNCYLLDHEDVSDLQTSVTAIDVKLGVFKQSLSRERGLFCYDIIGSVNGLVCFNFNNYSICNPVRGECLMVPDPPRHQDRPVVSGFGYDSVADDYKVVRIMKKNERDTEAEVYSLVADSWRTIDDVPNITSTGPSNAFVEGCLHWITHENGCKVIAYFNVETETFGVIQMPPCYCKEMINTFENLCVLSGNLCLIDDDLFSNPRIWMMKEYGVHESWTVEYVLRRDNVYRFWHGLHGMIQLSTGEIVMLNNRQKLVYYEPRQRSFRPIVVKTAETGSTVEVRQPIVQVGSLISPKCVAGR